MVKNYTDSTKQVGVTNFFVKTTLGVTSSLLTLKENSYSLRRLCTKGRACLCAMDGVWEEPLLSDSLILFDHKLGLTGSGKISALLVISPLDSLRVIQVHRL